MTTYLKRHKNTGELCLIPGSRRMHECPHSCFQITDITTEDNPIPKSHKGWVRHGSYRNTHLIVYVREDTACKTDKKYEQPTTQPTESKGDPMASRTEDKYKYNVNLVKVIVVNRDTKKLIRNELIVIDDEIDTKQYVITEMKIKPEELNKYFIYTSIIHTVSTVE